jgi:hypothetical protein
MGVSKCAFVSIAARVSALTIHFWSAGSMVSGTSYIAAVRMTGEKRCITYPPAAKFLAKPQEVTAANFAAAAATYT